MPLLGIAAERDYRRMLQQQQRVADLSLLAGGDQLSLQLQPQRVRHGSEMDDIDDQTQSSFLNSSSVRPAS